jgi:hypothetical protein
MLLTRSIFPFFSLIRTSINAQKIVDGMTQPEFTFTYFLREPRTFDRPLYGVAHPDLKYSDQGTRITFLAAKEYNEEDKKRRDELLAKYKKEESAES